MRDDAGVEEGANAEQDQRRQGTTVIALQGGKALTERLRPGEDCRGHNQNTGQIAQPPLGGDHREAMPADGPAAAEPEGPVDGTDCHTARGNEEQRLRVAPAFELGGEADAAEPVRREYDASHIPDCDSDCGGDVIVNQIDNESRNGESGPEHEPETERAGRRRHRLAAKSARRYQPARRAPARDEP